MQYILNRKATEPNFGKETINLHCNESHSMYSAVDQSGIGRLIGGLVSSFLCCWLVLSLATSVLWQRQEENVDHTRRTYTQRHMQGEQECPACRQSMRSNLSLPLLPHIFDYHCKYCFENLKCATQRSLEANSTAHPSVTSNVIVAMRRSRRKQDWRQKSGGISNIRTIRSRIQFGRALGVRMDAVDGGGFQCRK